MQLPAASCVGILWGYDLGQVELSNTPNGWHNDGKTGSMNISRKKKINWKIWLQIFGHHYCLRNNSNNITAVISTESYVAICFWLSNSSYDQDFPELYRFCISNFKGATASVKAGKASYSLVDANLKCGSYSEMNYYSCFLLYIWLCGFDKILLKFRKRGRTKPCKTWRNTQLGFLEWAWEWDIRVEQNKMKKMIVLEKIREERKDLCNASANNLVRWDSLTWRFRTPQADVAATDVSKQPQPSLFPSAPLLLALSQMSRRL